MYRPATSALRKQAQATFNTAVQTQSKRSFGANHPPAVHPYFGEVSEIYTPSAYTQNTPNSTYGDKFAHPMNYQGHVPVTPKKFSIEDNELDLPMPVPDLRVANAPSVYIAMCAVLSPLIGLGSAQITADLLLNNKPAQAGQLPWYLRSNMNSLLINNMILMQGNNRTVQLFQRLDGIKNVYQTEEFDSKLQEYVANRK